MNKRNESQPDMCTQLKPKGLSLGLGSQFFEYLSFGLGFGYFANSELDSLKYKKKFYLWV